MQLLMNLWRKKSVGWFIHLAALLIGCILIKYFFALPLPTYFLYLGVLLLTFTLFSLAFNTFESNRIQFASKLVYSIVSCLILFIAILHSDNVNSYGPLVADTVGAIYQTSLTEMVDYISLYTSKFAILFYLAWSILYVASISIIHKTKTSNPANKLLFSTIFCTGLVLISFGKKDAQLIFNEALAYSKTLSEFSDSRASVSDKYNLDSLTSDFKGNIIIVIGESTSRHHFGIYNYPNNTTPYLSSISNNLYVFNNVISTHSHTIPSLTDALSLNDRKVVRNINQIPDLITIAKKAGFLTAWLSNQNAIGIWDNGVAAIARQADIVKYHDANSGMQRKRSVFDEALVDSLQELITSDASNKKLIFLHMMATHFPYCEVIPDNFGSNYKYYDGVQSGFQMLGGYMAYLIDTRGKEYANHHLAQIDCYDRSVRYVDSVLEKTIELLKTDPNPTFLLYLSDHGEAPLLGTAHESRTHSHWHIEIPFLAWANDAFKHIYPAVVENIQNNVNQKGSLVDLSFSVSDIAKIKDISNIKKRSIFSKNYEAFERTSLHRTRGYDQYDKDSDYFEKTNAQLSEITQQLGTDKYEKIWAHRVNTIGSMIETKSLFSGIEMDIVYDSNQHSFHVFHPPAPNIGLTLERMLKQDDGKLRYWLDTKNITKNNVAEVLTKLEQLDQIYKIKNRVILESGTLDESSQHLSKHGWHISYYLPTEKILDCMKNCTSVNKQNLADELIRNRKMYGFAAVSFDLAIAPFFERYLLENTRQNELPVYTWNHKLNISNADNMDELVKFLEKDYINVILVKFPSYFNI